MILPLLGQYEASIHHGNSGALSHHLSPHAISFNLRTTLGGGQNLTVEEWRVIEIKPWAQGHKVNQP